MSVLWTTAIMEEIDRKDWGDGYPSLDQRNEMKQLVITWRRGLESALGLYELQWTRGRQGEEVIKL